MLLLRCVQAFQQRQQEPDLRPVPTTLAEPLARLRSQASEVRGLGFGAFERVFMRFSRICMFFSWISSVLHVFFMLFHQLSMDFSGPIAFFPRMSELDPRPYQEKGSERGCEPADVQSQRLFRGFEAMVMRFIKRATGGGKDPGVGSGEGAGEHGRDA